MPRHRRGWAMGGGPLHEGRHSPLRVSMLEPALLVLLKERPRHGYTLLNDLDTLGMRTMHPSMVYRTLRETEDLAWVQSDWDTDQTQGPPRRTYTLTQQGEEVLRNWKNELEGSQTLIKLLLEKITA
jgi:PadR family transcriptional regulator PadR